MILNLTTALLFCAKPSPCFSLLCKTFALPCYAFPLLNLTTHCLCSAVHISAYPVHYGSKICISRRCCTSAACYCATPFPCLAIQCLYDSMHFQCVPRQCQNLAMQCAAHLFLALTLPVSSPPHLHSTLQHLCYTLLQFAAAGLFQTMPEQNLTDHYRSVTALFLNYSDHSKTITSHYKTIPSHIGSTHRLCFTVINLTLTALLITMPRLCNP